MSNKEDQAIRPGGIAKTEDGVLEFRFPGDIIIDPNARALVDELTGKLPVDIVSNTALRKEDENERD